MAILKLALLIAGLFSSSLFAQDEENPFNLPENLISWSGWGKDSSNCRFAAFNTALNTSNIHKLKQHCRVAYAEGVSATPVVHRFDGVSYFPTWGGLLIALNHTNCKQVWAVNVTEIIETFQPLSKSQALTTVPVSRTSVQLSSDDVLFFGTQTHALIVAIDRVSGKFLAHTQINSHEHAIVTMSPTLVNVSMPDDGRNVREVLYVGASSAEELAAVSVPGYKCCSFVGNMKALEFNRTKNSFNLLWDLSMIPEELGGEGKWSGAALWGSSPAWNTGSQLIYIATGNTYSFPSGLDENGCSENDPSLPVQNCLPTNVWQNSVLALEANSGTPRWVRQLGPLDAWTVACIVNGTDKLRPVNCPQTPGPDADFGMSPAFVEGYGRDLEIDQGDFDTEDAIIVGQKNGNLYSMNSETGEMIWSTVVGPGGTLGGLSWGVAVDSFYVHFTVINSDGRNMTLLPSNAITTSSAYGAVSINNGSIVWETSTGEGLAFGPPSAIGASTNSVVLQPGPIIQVNWTMPVQKGKLLALDSASGRCLKEFELDAPLHGGSAIQGKYVIFGTGYKGYEGEAYLYVMKGE
ncbi:Quino protein alcohol dehydrogenase-like protein [Tothia fuscella]|uniref:Quino protein alcohol dehydrogenase-like protein n=1 Tax=Tothia fuscella TaxID=1048955 RepID=A0A9P4NXS7_9PEZI|nr:Quino protein alcohol dehydrogenase-like protein [Tothia fuscella]